MIKVCGSPSLICTNSHVIFKKAESHLQEVITTFEELPELPPPNQNGYYPLDIFFQSEKELNESAIHGIKRDVEFLLKVAKGEVPPTKNTEQQLTDISTNKVSLFYLLQKWLSCH